MVIYLDILIIENILMNYMILLTEKIIIKEKINNIRLIIASLFGSIASILFYKIRIKNIFITLVLKIFLSIIIIEISFFKKNIKNIINNILLFYLISFAFGGCSIGLLYMVNKINYIEIFKVSVAGGILMMLLIVKVFSNIYYKNRFSNNFCLIHIINEGQEKKLSGIIDTGNMLKDPISSKPVIIVEKDKLYEILPLELLENEKKIIRGDYEIKNEKYKSKFCLIPFSTISEQNGILLGCKVEKVKTEIDGKKMEKSNVIIGICGEKLSKTEKYSCIIGSNYIENLY